MSWAIFIESSLDFLELKETMLLSNIRSLFEPENPMKPIKIKMTLT